MLARYVRHWCSRSTVDSGIHFMEIDVFGAEFHRAANLVEQQPDVHVLADPNIDNAGNAAAVIDGVHTVDAWMNAPTATIAEVQLECVFDNRFR